MKKIFVTIFLLTFLFVPIVTWAAGLGASCATADDCDSKYCGKTNFCEAPPPATSPAGTSGVAGASGLGAKGACTPVATSIVPEECQCEAPLDQCNLGAVEHAIMNVAQFILGSIGGLALLMFVYGGLLYIIGGAVSSQTNKAKDVMKYAVEGLLIVMCAGLILKMILKALI